MWPDCKLKSSPLTPKVAQKVGDNSVYLKSDFFKLTQKIILYLGYFCKQICCQDLSKKSQYGHTAIVQQHSKTWKFNQESFGLKKQLKRTYVCRRRLDENIWLILPSLVTSFQSLGGARMSTRKGNVVELGVVMGL